MAKIQLRLSFDPTANKVDIDSNSGNPSQDLRVILEGLALCMAVNRRKQNVNAETMAEFVKREIDRICNQRGNYVVKDHKTPPNFLIP